MVDHVQGCLLFCLLLHNPLVLIKQAEVLNPTSNCYQPPCELHGLRIWIAIQFLEAQNALHYFEQVSLHNAGKSSTSLSERYRLPEVGVFCRMDSLQRTFAAACYSYSLVTVSKGQNSGIKNGWSQKAEFQASRF